MSDKQDNKQLLLQQIDLEAVGRRIAEALVEAIAKPEAAKLAEGLRELARKTGKVPAEPEGKRGRKRKWPAVCSEPGCENETRAKGLCAKHYQRMRHKAKGPRPGAVRGIRDCLINGCDRKVHARGMCGAHFMEWVRSKREAKDPEQKKERKNRGPSLCSEPGCEAEVRAFSNELLSRRTKMPPLISFTFSQLLFDHVDTLLHLYAQCCCPERGRKTNLCIVI